MKKLLSLFLLMPLCSSAQNIKIPFAVVDSLTRPANMTAYAAGDALNDTATTPKVLVFTLSGNNGLYGEITEVFAVADSSNSFAVKVHFYTDSTGIERTADNSPIVFSGRNGKIGKKIGSAAVTIASSVASSAGIGQNTAVGIPFRCVSTSTKLYAIVEVTGTPTPQALERFYFIIRGFVYGS